MTGDRRDDLAAVVDTSQGSYRVVVGRDVLGGLPRELARARLSGRVYLVADQAVFPQGVRRVQEALERGGCETHVLTLPSGERTKSLETISKVYAWLARRKAERGDAVLALGGGVIGDAAGFAAATWLRGVPFVQVPTTLASMVDASTGGKVAVNLPQGKNLVGAFHQPKLVLSDVAFLETLPRRELAAGWAEAVKHGFILDPGLLSTFEEHAEALWDLKPGLAEEVIRRSVAIKAEIVSADEFERGETRVLLNYGHTIGHALEAITDYGRYLHGEAVAVGMMGAAMIAQRLRMIHEDLVERHRDLISRFKLPVSAQDVSPEAILETARSDKKVRGGRLRWVLLEEAGKAVTRQDVPNEIVEEVLSELVKG